MFCPKCGNNIPDNVQFCTKCGAAVRSVPGPAAQAPSAAAVKEKPPRKKRGKKVLIAAVLIVAALVFIPSLLSSPEDQTGKEDAPPAQDPSEQETPTEQDGTDGGALEPVEPGTGPTEELLGYVDQTEELMGHVVDAMGLATTDDGDGFAWENCYQIAEEINGCLAEMEELQDKASAVDGAEPPLLNAVGEYFNMVCNSVRVMGEMYQFWGDYDALYSGIVGRHPLEVDYDSLSEYSEVLSKWARAAKICYDDFPSCPASIKNEWEQYGRILEYNDRIAEKLKTAVDNNDWLRYYSAKMLTNRYFTAENAMYNKLVTTYYLGECEHTTYQRQHSVRLAQEIHAYAELPEEERKSYRFKNLELGTILTRYDAIDTIYPSLYNTYDAFAIIKTGCINGTREILVEAEIEGFTQKYRETFKLTPAYKAIYIKPPALTGQLDLSAAKPAQLKITISEKDGTLIEAKTFNITLKSKTDFRWYSDEYGLATQDNILCYLTPEADAITDLKVKAAGQIGAMLGEPAKSFVGYQRYSSSWTDAANTYLQAAGLMNALNAMDVVYVNNSFTLSGEGQQHITFPADALAHRSALCIETSLIVASALQSAGMHAFLVFPRGHAMVAVEAWNSGTFQGEYFLIETTDIAGSGDTERFLANLRDIANGHVPAGWKHEGEYGLREPIEYLTRSQWQDYLENYFEYVVDCDDSRLLGLTAFAN